MKSRARIIYVLLLTLALPVSRGVGRPSPYPLPEDRGTAGTLAALQKLPVYARILHITAHPDDENAGTLTWLSRKLHVQTALYCLTRGEGGQNILGNEKYEALGLVRTGELLEACRHYGVALYFGRAVDFGFSKAAEETLGKWGYQATLGDMVRFIRRWRPAVIVSRFQGTRADGHGHHQAAGILVRNAFHAAADPNRFPEQIQQGLTTWQAKKLYVSHSGGESAQARAGEGTDLIDWTVRVPVGDYDPVLGRSYKEIAAEGYAKHRTQGNGAAFSPPGPSFEYFRLLESSVGSSARESNFFDSIDTTLTGILALAGGEQAAVPFLEESLIAAKQAGEQALRGFQASRPENSAAAVTEGISILTGLIRRIETSGLSAPSKTLLGDALRKKLAAFHDALSAVLGIRLTAISENAAAIPGDIETVIVNFYNRGTATVSLKDITLKTAWPAIPQICSPSFGEQPATGAATCRFSVAVPADAKATEPFWYLESGQDARYAVRPAEDEFSYFDKPEIIAEAGYRYLGAEIPIRATARAQSADPLRGAEFHEFQIVPALSLTLEPRFRIAPASRGDKTYAFRVSVLNNRKSATKGTVRLASGMKWHIQPAEAPFELLRKGETFTALFRVQVPAGTPSGDYPIEAIAALDGQEFRRGYQTIAYLGNWTRNLYSASRSSIKVFPIKVPEELIAAYIPGAGDEIPVALEELGVQVRVLSSADLAFGDLRRFHLIITGIRAYNVNEGLRANNRRLLDYVMKGGTLIVQYVRAMERPMPANSGSSFPFGPYPMSVSDLDRITVEGSPVRILDPANAIFNRPNKITEADFQGWVQERGLYFMSTWDERYLPLLSGNDPGEAPKNGGMLYARYGKGHFIYTGYSWFRQLPAGIPGAYRIFANMISLGRP